MRVPNTEVFPSLRDERDGARISSSQLRSRWYLATASVRLAGAHHLSQDVLHVRFDGAFRHEQAERISRVCLTGGQGAQHVGFPGRQVGQLPATVTSCVCRGGSCCFSKPPRALRRGRRVP